MLMTIAVISLSQKRLILAALRKGDRTERLLSRKPSLQKASPRLASPLPGSDGALFLKIREGRKEREAR